MKKVLFIDRDGTLIEEPPVTFQIDRTEQFVLLPGVLSSLKRICSKKEFRLVMVTNQDRLGTDVHPEDRFQTYQDLLLRILKSEEIEFDEICINRSTPEDNDPNRKPEIGMVREYLNGDYDLANSYVIGDRVTDIQFAANLGCRGIYLKGGPTQTKADLSKLEKVLPNAVFIADDWLGIEKIVTARKALVVRNTAETRIRVELNLDGTGQSEVETGLNFLDHMLDQIGKHGGFDLKVSVEGDLEVDEHHTIEDTALALGTAFREALGDKKGIERYGFYLPMDDADTWVGLDFGGRPWFKWKAKFKREYVGDMPTEMVSHFFKSFTDEAKCNLVVRCKGDNDHHKVESIFKAFARSLKSAAKRDPSRSDVLPSTKGVL